jgi:hypothetical protein
MSYASPDSHDSLDSHIDNGEWAMRVARRETAEIEPVCWSDLKFNPKATVVKPRRMRGFIVPAGKLVVAMTAITMIRKSHAFMSEDGAAAVFVRIISDPDSRVVTRGADGRSMSHGRLAAFRPDLGRRIFIADEAGEVPMDELSVSYAELVVWLRDNALSKAICFPERSVAAMPEPAMRREIPRNDYRDADLPLVHEMRQLIESKQATGKTDAARAGVKRAAGRGNDKTKVGRLVKLYTATYG